MSRSMNSTRNRTDVVGGSTVNGTFYRTQRRHHAKANKHDDIRAQVAEMLVEGRTEANFILAVRDEH